VIKNNIIAFNKADNEGGGMYGGSGNAYNDFWMNEGGNLAGGATKGTGDITFNPLFAIEGYWDGSVWVEGDYHLKSEVGRWDPNNGIWITDTVTSRCIDAGNPGCPLGDEPNEPSNVRINMGAYGGTVEASKTPPEWGLLPDLTNDWMVDYEDFVHQSKDWQEIANCQPGDLNRDGTVNLPDISIMALHWLEDNNP
jgi:hypothetical protein